MILVRKFYIYFDLRNQCFLFEIYLNIILKVLELNAQKQV